jgi:hypothetical protein
MCKCGVAFGVGACLFCVAASEAFEYKRPSASLCEGYFFRDLGPPPGCGDDSMPHNRTGWVTSIANSTGSISSITVTMPMVAFTARDAEDGADPTDQGFEVTAWSTPRST